MNSLDSNPHSLAHLRLRNYHHKPTLDTCEPISLITQLGDLYDSGLASTDWWLTEIWLL